MTRIVLSEKAMEELSGIREELYRQNELKRTELNMKKEELAQQWFFIELIEEVLPIDDGMKKTIHERVRRIGRMYDEVY